MGLEFLQHGCKALFAAMALSCTPVQAEGAGPAGPSVVQLQAGDATGAIPAEWFEQNGLGYVKDDPEASAQDPDGDGFTNWEEYRMGTSPTDPASFPPLISGVCVKMEVVEVCREALVIEVDGAFAYEMAATPETEVRISLSSWLSQKRLATVNVKTGDSFGYGEDEGRFTVIGFRKETFQDAHGDDCEEMAVLVRDNKAQAGDEREFTIRSGPSPYIRGGAGHNSSKGRLVRTHYAVLRVTAGPMRGDAQNGVVKVRENHVFTIPGTQTRCQLVGIDDNRGVTLSAENAQCAVSVGFAAGARVRSAPSDRRGYNHKQTPSADENPAGGKPFPQKRKKHQK